MPASNNDPRKSQTIPPDSSTYKKPEDIARDFLAAFRAETDKTRSLILRDIQATDTLSRIGVTNFRELFLEHIARERGLVFNRFDPPSPACTRCGCIGATLIDDEKNLYLCKECDKKFAPNKDTVSFRAKVSLLTYAKLLHCLLNYETVAQTCERCDIAPNTYYRLRNHIYYLISVYLSGLSLCGEIQIDETYLNISYKGTNLQKSDFDEEDILFPQTNKPRDSRKRGGAYSISEANANKLCVFTAVDARGYVYSCYAGIGTPSARMLKKHVDIDKFLPVVPETIAYPYPLKAPRKTDSKPGDRSLLIFDGSNALKTFVNRVVQVDYYSRVYRRNGVQTKAPEKFKHLNTQRVNYIHRRLKEHIRRTGSGSSRYLRGTLLLFDFMMNTGAPKNQAAVDALLRLLVVPGLRKSSGFYDNYFSLPSYITEWADDDNALSKLPPQKALAYWLYDRHKNPENYSDTPTITLEEVQDECGLSLPTIRAAYRDFKAAGYHDRIVKRFNQAHFPHLVDGTEKVKKPAAPIDDIDAAALEIFDRRAAERVKPYRLRKSFAVICDEVNKEYHSNYVASSFFHLIPRIIESGLREAPPDINTTNTFLDGYPVTETCFFFLEQYDALIDEARLQNKEPIGTTKAYDILAEMFPDYKRSSIRNMVGQARRYLRKMDAPGENGICHDTTQSHIREIYDAYAEYRRTHWKDSKQEHETFWKVICKKYNLNVTIEWLRIQMRRISNAAKANGGELLPAYLPYPRKTDLPDSGLEVVAHCNKIMEQREKKGQAPLLRKEMVAAIKKKMPDLSTRSIDTYLSRAHIAFPPSVQKLSDTEHPEMELLALAAYDKLIEERSGVDDTPLSFAAAATIIMQREKKLSHLKVRTVAQHISHGLVRRQKVASEQAAVAQHN